MTLVFAILATILSAFSSVAVLVMLLAGSPNSSPEQLARIKAYMLSVLAVWIIGTIGAVWAMIVGRHAVGAACGIAPTVFCAVLFIVLLIISG